MFLMLGYFLIQLKGKIQNTFLVSCQYRCLLQLLLLFGVINAKKKKCHNSATHISVTHEMNL